MRLLTIRLAATTALFLGCFGAQSQTNLINFDDGVQGQAISGFYSCHGLSMSNAVWSPNRDARGIPFAGASGTLILLGDASGSAPSRQSPIVARFRRPVQFVAICATDVGLAGARIEAFDAESGGNLLGSAEAFGDGVGFDVYRELEIAQPGIRRVEVFQPAPNGSDGVVWDNLRFASVPPAISNICMYAGLQLEGGVGSHCRIEWTADLSSSNWTALTNVTIPCSPYVFIDQTSGGAGTRFYRTVPE